MTDLPQLFATALRLAAEGQTEQAAQTYREIVRAAPGHAVAHLNLGALLHDRGELASARAHYEQAIRVAPTFAPAHNNLGNLLRDLGDVAAAHACYREALRLDPNFTQALSNCGSLLHVNGQMDAALACYDRALQLDPGLSIVHFNRAKLYDDTDRIPEAIAGYRESWRLDPNYPAPGINLAILFNSIEEPDEALECCRKVLDLGADCAMVRRTVAGAMRALGRGDEAIAWYRGSLELEADPVQHSNLLYALNFQAGLDPAAVFAEHRAWAIAHAEPLTLHAAPHTKDRTPDRRLRVGYVSPHFREHAVNFFTEPLLAAHDPQQCEIFCYSDSNVSDDATARLRAAVDVWRDVHQLSDEQIAALVRQDHIDILVDLTGHIGGNRLLVFARKPAPVQVTYIGYQNTTGMLAMDYRLTDEQADPPGRTDAFYTERLVRLPGSFFCYRPDDYDLQVSPLPALERGAVTFGSFNLFAKVTPQVIETWLGILARVPRSRLLVLANRGGYAERQLHERAQARGVDPGRVEVFQRLPRIDYLRLMQQVDIALDPFPFNGHTTTCDAVWMGLPVVMLEGQTYASRFGGSVLKNVGLDGLMTTSVEAYADTAVALATNLPSLAQLRSELRPRMAASCLLDFSGFARRVESAYRQMWIDWCREG
jgi:protein O-GlcNAc transferase